MRDPRMIPLLTAIVEGGRLIAPDALSPPVPWWSLTKTALAAALRLQSMMWERFGQLREALLALTQEAPSNRVGQTGAQILPFRKPD